MENTTIKIKEFTVIISKCDFERVIAHNWSLAFYKKSNNSPYFQYRTPRPEREEILLHRFIVNCPAGKCVDHINGNTLDNRRENLRICTQAENRCNSRIQNNNTSGYKGVSWSEGHKKWRSQIKLNKKIIHLGYFNTPEEAYAAYCAASEKYHGEYGRCQARRLPMSV
jgi:hypothetical protein